MGKTAPAAGKQKKLKRKAHPAIRFLSSVLIVSGMLLISDAVLTLVWQEPVTWFVGKRGQSQLEDALANPPQRVVERKPLKGDAIGKITMPSLDRSYYVVEGTGTGDLRKGPGHYPDTPLPGERGTVAIAGHRTTYLAPFRTIDDFHRGDEIIVDMPYGRFVYRYEKKEIVDPSQIEVTRKVSYNRLVLTACHPLYSAAQRVVAFARLDHREPARVGRD